MKRRIHLSRLLLIGLRMFGVVDGIKKILLPVKKQKQSVCPGNGRPSLKNKTQIITMKILYIRFMMD